jgi:hypothetical protein
MSIHSKWLVSQLKDGQAVVSERVESVQGLKDQLGKCRNLLQTRSVEESFGVSWLHSARGLGDYNCAHIIHVRHVLSAVYGRSDRHNDDWDAKACLEGDYSYSEQCPDNDLGASITPG